MSVRASQTLGEKEKRMLIVGKWWHTLGNFFSRQDSKGMLKEIGMTKLLCSVLLNCPEAVTSSLKTGCNTYNAGSASNRLTSCKSSTKRIQD